MRFFKQLPPSLPGMDPDQIFLDASNLPRFDQHQFEGRLEKPISRRIVWGLAVCALVVGIIFLGRLWNLQVSHGAAYNQLAENNSLRPSILFAPRGENGFGYDPLFVPVGFEQSFAELDEDVKNRLSHRAKALEKLKAHITKLPGGG